MTRDDLRALMAAILARPPEPHDLPDALESADAILAEMHPEPEVTIAPGPHSVEYNPGWPIKDPSHTIAFDDEWEDEPTPPKGEPREPDGWIGEFSSYRLVLDPSHPRAGKAPYTRPIYIGSPPPERAEVQRLTKALTRLREEIWAERALAAPREPDGYRGECPECGRVWWFEGVDEPAEASCCRRPLPYRPIYIGSPPPERAESEEHQAPYESEGRWFDRGYAAARAEVLEEVRALFDSAGMDPAFNALLDRLSR